MSFTSYLLRRHQSIYRTTEKCFQTAFSLPFIDIIKTTSTNFNRFSSTKSSTSSLFSQTIQPFSIIKILNCDYNLKIKPNDILDPNDSNTFRGQIYNENIETNDDDPPLINIETDGNIITVKFLSSDPQATNKDNKSLMSCVILEVPVKCDLTINSERDVNIENMSSDVINVKTKGNIRTSNLQGIQYDFESEMGGNISCQGRTLANQMNIRSRRNGNIHMDKLQGNDLIVKSDSGCISTNSCYFESSKFVSKNGKLLLKNVHKNAEMYLLESGGELDVTGFQGKLFAHINSGKLSFQLTEIYADSFIEVKGQPDEFLLRISDFVEDNTQVKINANKIEINEMSSGDLLEHLNNDGKCLEINKKKYQEMNEDKLTIICNDGVVNLGKTSWVDTILAKSNK